MSYSVLKWEDRMGGFTLTGSSSPSASGLVIYGIIKLSIKPRK